MDKQNVCYVHKTEHDSALERREILTPAATRMNLEASRAQILCDSTCEGSYTDGHVLFCIRCSGVRGLADPAGTALPSAAQSGVSTRQATRGPFKRKPTGPHPHPKHPRLHGASHLGHPPLPS